jgi:hypothetical protein
LNDRKEHTGTAIEAHGGEAPVFHVGKHVFDFVPFSVERCV